MKRRRVETPLRSRGHARDELFENREIEDAENSKGRQEDGRMVEY